MYTIIKKYSNTNLEEGGLNIKEESFQVEEIYWVEGVKKFKGMKEIKKIIET
jgi:hypothetical protein